MTNAGAPVFRSVAASAAAESMKEKTMTVFAPTELNIDRHKTNAIGMLTHSEKWWDAAEALFDVSHDRLQPGVDFSPPIYFLALHCLECTLKSFLCARGIAEKTLKKKFGHDLSQLLKAARELGLDRLIPITPEMEARINLMAPDYGDKELQYCMGNALRQWALPAEVIADVGRIHDALSDEYRSQVRVTTPATGAA
jgi:hypothetical protein